MMRIACLRQAVRIAELLCEADQVEFFELGNTLEQEPTSVHLKMFCSNGHVLNYYIDGEGNAPIKGAVGAWGIVKAERPS